MGERGGHQLDTHAHKIKGNRQILNQNAKENQDLHVPDVQENYGFWLGAACRSKVACLLAHLGFESTLNDCPNLKNGRAPKNHEK